LPAMVAQARSRPAAAECKHGPPPRRAQVRGWRAGTGCERGAASAATSTSAIASASSSLQLACWHGTRAGRGFSRHEHKRDRECKLPVTALFPHLLLHLRQAINVCQIHAQRGRAFVPQFAC
jgi:hypothetical protein